MSNAQPEITSIHWDMDGVIVDSEAMHVAAEQQTCLDHGFDIDPASWGGFKGQTAADIFNHLIATYGDPAEHDAASLISHKTDLFLEQAAAELEPIPGVLEMLERSRESIRTMNLVTSSNARVQEFVVEHIGIRHLFDHAINGDDVKNGKPDPEPYLLSLERADAKPDTALVVEDSKSGIKSGLAAGCLVLAIATSHSAAELASAQPTIIAEDYPDAWRQLDGYQLLSR